ncbi:conserved hypothetical protein [Sporisorium reilianum SRZ2]|uniref:Histone H4 n=1 Tax=Sporisorium reilianum (strain SRZ2) TaxID=999809 RepID=E6ZSC9_SPORE|nr:conserved hypothetical protein [Sporisorium reilianum SRZ2]
MTAGPAIQLLPPPIDISFGDDQHSLPQCTANLMPFSIDYDGPAPVDSFLVQRPASPATDAVPDNSTGESFISAFRGRAIQSTPLPLPAGFVAKVVSVSQVVSSPTSTSDGSTTALAQTDANEEAEREKKRRRIANQPPARQQKFSMDSDDDDEGDADQDDVDSIHDASPPPQSPEPQPADQQKPHNAGPTIHIRPLATVHPNHLTVWGPDGPVDKGDDSFFRTVGEWYSVVSPLSIKTLAGQGSGRTAERATKRYRAQRSALERITKGSIRRLARRGGVKRLAGTVYEETRFILRDFVARAVRDAIVYSRKHPRTPLALARSAY